MMESAKKSILLIDDDALVLQSIAQLLEKSGYLVRSFRDPRAAVQEAMMEDFDLVISDIRMPEMDGFQAIRYIRDVRTEKGKSQIPEIFITGYAKDYETETARLRPRAVIHKPFALDEFLEVIRRALK